MLVEPISRVLLYIKERSEKLFLMMIKIKKKGQAITGKEIVLFLCGPFLTLP
jgi:hypothetical protein